MDSTVFLGVLFGISLTLCILGFVIWRRRVQKIASSPIVFSSEPSWFVKRARENSRRHNAQALFIWNLFLTLVFGAGFFFVGTIHIEYGESETLPVVWEGSSIRPLEPYVSVSTNDDDRFIGVLHKNGATKDVFLDTDFVTTHDTSIERVHVIRYQTRWDWFHREADEYTFTFNYVEGLGSD